MARKPTTSAKKAAKKVKAPARRGDYGELLAFISALVIAADARDSPDCLLTAEERFQAAQQDLCDLVNKVGEYLGTGLSFTPLNLPVDAVWDLDGLRGSWTLVLGHFETAAVGLFGVLRAVGYGGVLKSAVWRLLNTALGAASFHEMALWNIVPFAAHHNAGKGLMDDWPEEAKALLLRLQVSSLNALGAPAKVAGFGDEVKTWLKRHVANVWPGANVPVGPGCVHMCMFTQGRWKNVALSRPAWFQGFSELVSFLGGDGDKAAKELRKGLSKDGDYDPAYAQQLEQWHRDRLKKFGLFGSAWSPRRIRWFKRHVKLWGRWGTLVDPETIKARKLHMVKYGCFGTEVPAEVIEERKKARRDWWTPARRQDASDAKTDWWNDSRREDQSQLKVKWWSDKDEGAARREALSLSQYHRQAAKRGDTNPPDPIWLPPTTVCPKCHESFGARRIVRCRMAQGCAQICLPCCDRPKITNAARRAEVLSTCAEDEGGAALELAIIERMALVVSRYNAAKEDEAKKTGKRFSPYIMPAHIADARFVVAAGGGTPRLADDYDDDDAKARRRRKDRERKAHKYRLKRAPP